MRIHYRSPLNYSFDALNDAKAQYTRLLTTFDTISESVPNDECQRATSSHVDAFWAALYNDLNISEAIAELFAINKLIHHYQCGTQLLTDLGQSIGLFVADS